ncbi:hypothetical protein AVEN_33735-1 [Araneus ventricosus]|uniref:Uncharacterized protein n=1 Tax=Araneus ventricosus TaxID=182803 RepID=A0A4Y2NKA6_ARAVE|nr:hypothetical protein AVEN_33735-1 [Araneus ventricosus]
MHSVIDCFHSNQPNLNILLRSSQRNLSATKYGDLIDKTTSFPARATLFPYLLLPPTKNTSHSLWNEESGSVQGVRIRTGKPNQQGLDLNWMAMNFSA